MMNISAPNVLQYSPHRGHTSWLNSHTLIFPVAGPVMLHHPDSAPDLKQGKGEAIAERGDERCGIKGNQRGWTFWGCVRDASSRSADKPCDAPYLTRHSRERVPCPFLEPPRTRYISPSRGVDASGRAGTRRRARGSASLALP